MRTRQCLNIHATSVQHVGQFTETTSCCTQHLQQPPTEGVPVPHKPHPFPEQLSLQDGSDGDRQVLAGLGPWQGESRPRQREANGLVQRGKADGLAGRRCGAHSVTEGGG